MMTRLMMISSVTTMMRIAGNHCDQNLAGNYGNGANHSNPDRPQRNRRPVRFNDYDMS